MTKELEEKVAALEAVLQGIKTISIAYLPTGAVLSASIGVRTVGDLRAAKAALLNLATQVDKHLLLAVEQAVKEQVPPSPRV